MHVAILALGVGAPVSPIAYEFKTVELFRSLGYEFELPSIETLSSASLVSAFEAGVENYERVARIVHQRVDHNRQQVWQTAVILRETFPEFAQTAPNERSQVRGLSNAVEDRLTAIH
jgi:colanic acid/amylovoran biosynthesis protein